MLSLLLEHFEKAVETIDSSQITPKSSIYLRLIHEIIPNNYYARDRIFGTGVEYIGRLLRYLYKNDVKAKELIQSRYEEYLSEKNSVRSSTTTLDDKPDEGALDAFKAKKLDAKRKQNALMELQKMKQAKLMQKMLASENMTQDEMEKMDANRRDESIKAKSKKVIISGFFFLFSNSSWK